MSKREFNSTDHLNPEAVAAFVDGELSDSAFRRAARRGRSMEEEARAILRAAVARDDPARPPLPLGARIGRRFAGLGFSEEAPELRGQAARPADDGA